MSALGLEDSEGSPNPSIEVANRPSRSHVPSGATPFGNRGSFLESAMRSTVATAKREDCRRAIAISARGEPGQIEIGPAAAFRAVDAGPVTMSDEVDCRDDIDAGHGENTESTG